jgi:hypothetical protein
MIIFQRKLIRMTILNTLILNYGILKFRTSALQFYILGMLINTQK